MTSSSPTPAGSGTGPADTPGTPSHAGGPPTASDGGGPCPGCAAAAAEVPPGFVYGLGHVEMRFGSVALEREFAQTVSRMDTTGLTAGQVRKRVLSDPANRHLIRNACWVLTSHGVDTYILQPHDPRDFDGFAEAIRAEPTPDALDLVVGVTSPVVTRTPMCGGLQLPMVLVDQLHSFTRTELIDAIPIPPETDAARFKASAREVLDHVLAMAVNAGALDEHRALNYLAVRYPPIYAKTAAMSEQGASLTSVRVRASRLAGQRSLVKVIFAYTHRSTDVVEQFFVRVDVTERYPFLVSKLSPYFETD